MLTAFIGCSCVGKSTIMSLLSEQGFMYVRNIVTRHSRFGEYHKITVSDLDFEIASKNNELILQNEHFGYKYSYLKSDIEKAISSVDIFYMIDYGIENIKQLDSFSNLYKIILIPESIDLLNENIIKSGRQERLDEILSLYRNYYAYLEEGYNQQLNAFVIKNKKNDHGGVAFNVIKYLIHETNVYFSGSPLFRKDRLSLILGNLGSHPPARNALEAYKLLSNSIDEFEDQVWGKNKYSPPRSFLNGTRTDRMYTIFPESFFEVPEYSGVTLLLSRQELIFISRYGAIEIQHKDTDDKYGDKVPFESRRANVSFEKKDSSGDGVWVEKNK